METQNLTKVYLLMLIVPLIWGGAFSVIKHALTEIPPISLCAFRYSLGAVLMLAWTVRQNLWNFNLARQYFYILTLVSLLGIWGFNIFLNIGTMYTSAITVALIIVASPSLTALLAILFFGETCTKQTVAGIIISMAGVVLAVSSKASITLATMSFGIGEFYLVLAALCWSGYTLVIKNAVAKKNIDPTLVTAVATTLGAVLLSITAAGRESAWLKSFNPAAISAQVWLEVIFLSVFATFIAFIMYSWAVKSIGATKTSAYSNLTPINAMWIAVLIYGETASINQIIGMFVTIFGVVLTTTSKTKLR